MMRTRWNPGLRVWSATLVAGLSLGTILPAAGQEPVDRFAIALQAGGGLFSMNDANRQIRQGNEFLEERGWTQLDELSIAFDFVGDLRARIYGPVALSLGGAYLVGNTKVDFDEVIEIRPSASLYHLRLLYQIPYRPIPKLILRGGAGPVYLAEGEVRAQHEVRRVEGGTQRVETAYFRGTGWGWGGLLEGELILNEKTSIVADIGWRSLNVDRDEFEWKISDVENPELDDGDPDDIPNKWDLDTENGFLSHSFLEMVLGPGDEPITDADGKPLVVPRGMEKLDFSGARLNVGLRFYLF